MTPPPPPATAGAVTSGDLAHTHLQERADPFWQGLGRRCLHTTWSSRGGISLEGLDLEVSVEETSYYCCPAPIGRHPTAVCTTISSFPRPGLKQWRMGPEQSGTGKGAAPLAHLEQQQLVQHSHSPRAQIVSEPSAADFILAHGTEAQSLPPTTPGGAAIVSERTMEELQELLQECAARPRPPPLICGERFALLRHTRKTRRCWFCRDGPHPVRSVRCFGLVLRC